MWLRINAWLHWTTFKHGVLLDEKNQNKTFCGTPWNSDLNVSRSDKKRNLNSRSTYFHFLRVLTKPNSFHQLIVCSVLTIIHIIIISKQKFRYNVPPVLQSITYEIVFLYGIYMLFSLFSDFIDLGFITHMHIDLYIF